MTTTQDTPALEGAPLDSYSAEDQAFFKFWYGHMKNEQMTGALSDVRHATARYIWDAAIAVQGGLAVSPEVRDYRYIAHLIGSIFFAGDFKAETNNERLLESLLVKTGHRFQSWEEITADADRLDRMVEAKPIGQ